MLSHLPPRARRVVAVKRALASAVLSRPLACALLAGRRGAPRAGRTLDPQIAALLALDGLDPGSDLSLHAPGESRIRLAMQIAVVEGRPEAAVATEDRVVPGPGGQIPVRLYTPPGAGAPSPGIVFYHGGGWVLGSIATHDSLCRALALGTGCRVASVEYRLAPEHRFPAGADDAVAAFRWVVAHAGELGVDPSRVAVAGDSAGANLSAVVSLKTRGDARPPALEVLIYPGVDGTFSQPSHATLGEGYFLTRRTMEWFVGHTLGDGDRRHPDFSLLLRDDVSGAAPALVYTAGFDPLRDEGHAYAERLRAAGVTVRYWEFPSLVHGFALMTGAVAAARQAVDEIAGDVARALARG